MRYKDVYKRQGHRFVRYADDCMIFCKSRKSAERTLKNIIPFIEGKLFLKVNRKKTEVSPTVSYTHLDHGYATSLDMNVYSWKEDIENGESIMPVSYTHLPQPDKSKVVLDETNNEDVDKEATVDPEKTVSAKNNVGAMATILILALGGVAAYYYFKIYKPKKEEDEDDRCV